MSVPSDELTPQWWSCPECGSDRLIFDRSLCGECYSMHEFCGDCGEQAEPCHVPTSVDADRGSGA